MSKTVLTTNPKIPVSKAFRPFTQRLVVAANALGTESCLDTATSALATTKSALPMRFREESEGSLKSIQYARLRFDEERRVLTPLRQGVAGLVGSPGDRGAAAKIIIEAVDLVLAELAAARAVAPKLLDEIESELPPLELPEVERLKVDYREVIDATKATTADAT